MPDPTAPRKLSRWPLILAFGVAGLVIVAWSIAWVWARGQVQAELAAGASRLRSAGYELSWREQTIGGYPFRLDVTLTEPRIRDRSGWALEAPRLEAEAFLHAPTHWIIAAPAGLTFVRPVGGPVRVEGKLIRASLSHLQNTPPNLSFEGVDLRFEPAAGANTFALQAAQRIEFHLRQAPAGIDEGGVWLSVKDGKAQLAGLLGRIAGDKPISIEWDGRLSKMSAFRGRDWPSAVRRWSAAGGVMNVKRAGLTAGDALLGVNAGALGVGDDGRAEGSLDVSLRQAPRALDALGSTGTIPQATADAAVAVAEARRAGDVARMTLTFQAGQVTLGPVAIARSPKVYETAP